jgi:hypothetical protein
MSSGRMSSLTGGLLEGIDSNLCDEVRVGIFGGTKYSTEQICVYSSSEMPRAKARYQYEMVVMRISPSITHSMFSNKTSSY